MKEGKEQGAQRVSKKRKEKKERKKGGEEGRKENGNISRNTVLFHLSHQPKSW